MSLWGASDSDESKPKNLTTAEKKQVFANASGWVLEAGSALSGNNNTSAEPEILDSLRCRRQYTPPGSNRSVPTESASCR